MSTRSYDQIESTIGRLERIENRSRKPAAMSIIAESIQSSLNQYHKFALLRTGRVQNAMLPRVRCVPAASQQRNEKII
jgi:hypothetical protein